MLGYRCALCIVAVALVYVPVELRRLMVCMRLCDGLAVIVFVMGAPPDTALLQKAHLDSSILQMVCARPPKRCWQIRGHRPRSFISEWFRLDRLERISRDVLAETSSEVQFILGKMEPSALVAVVGVRSEEELQKMVEHQVFEVDGDYLDLLTTDTTFVDQKLLDMYRNTATPGDVASSFGVAPSGNAIQQTGQPDSNGFAAAVAPESPRRGLLGTMAVLSQLGKQNETSPTRRGLYIMRRILCLEVGEPPDNIDQCKRPEGTSRRESMEVHHMCTPTCSGCHKQMDPIGFALDSFDTVGRHRGTDDWGFPLDTAVNWTLIDKGTTEQIAFDSLKTMSAAFAELPQATDCVTKQVFRFATGARRLRPTGRGL